jgi:hypothetical protein
MKGNVMKTIKPEFQNFSEIIKPEEIGAKYSCYGNTYTILTTNVVYVSIGGEYGHFLIASENPVVIECEDQL